MKLQDVLKGLQFNNEVYDANYDIKDIIYDSRKAFSGCLFVCISGFQSDGHSYASAAFEKGARVFIAEKEISLPNEATVLYVEDSRKALAILSTNYFSHPAKEMKTIAITGTKGKTSVSFMLKSIFEAKGLKVGVIGSTGIFIGDKFYDSMNSTPESYLIHKYYREMVNDGCDIAIIEATSQGFKLHRTYGIHFDIGAFTNLSPDHIGPNEHSDFDDYLNCKKMIFSQCDKVIVNADCESFEKIIDGFDCEIITAGSGNNHQYGFINPVFSAGENKLSTAFTVCENGEEHIVNLNTPGYFSLYNAIISVAIARTADIDYDSIKSGLAKAFVKGRMEIVPTDTDFTVIIDFAHNEFSVKTLFETMKIYNPSRIISVFGCGGNRSKLRRYGMGEVIGANSDLSIITSDNSRFEKVEDIINDILVGMHKTDGKYVIIPERKFAIKEALNVAKEGDVILLIGKGHEMYEEIEGVQYPFDERQVVMEALFELRQQGDL